MTNIQIENKNNYGMEMKHVLRNFLSVDLPGILFSGVPTFALRCRHFSVTPEKWILVYLRKLVILRHTCTNLVSSHFQEMNSIIEHAFFSLRLSLTLCAEASFFQLFHVLAKKCIHIQIDIIYDGFTSQERILAFPMFQHKYLLNFTTYLMPSIYLQL